jgi:hypothetical protein
MKRIVVGLIILLILSSSGCAMLQSACEQGDAIKSKIRAALQIAQVGYPIVMQLVGETSNPDVHYNIALLDSALNILGQLSYDILCPDLIELNKANSALEQALDAKTALGVPVK